MKKILSPEKQSEKRLTPGIIVMIYAVVGVLWIAVSDNIVHMMSKDPEIITRLQTYKGWFYIGLTAVMLYWLVRRYGDARRESEEKFRSIFDNGIDGILLADSESKKFFHGNKMICQMTGYSLEEIKTLGVHDIHPEEDLPYVIDQFERQLGNEFTLAKDIPVKRKDGSVFYTDINSTPITLAGKRYLMGFFRDITERKKAEEKLLETTQTLQSLIKTSPLAICVLDPAGYVLLWNPAAERIFGWMEAEVLGKPYAIVPKEKQEEFVNLFGRAMRGEALSNIEIVRQRKDGSRVDVSLSTAPVYDAAGSLVGAMGIIADITEKRRAEEAQKESEKRYRNLFDSTMDGIYQTDGEGVFTLVNPAMARILGYASVEDLIGRRSQDYLSDVKEREAYVRELRSKKSVSAYPVRGKRGNGEAAYAEISSHILKDENGTILGTEGIMRDVTGRRMAEEEMRTRALQQEAVARLGQRALIGIPLDDLLNETVIKVAEILDVEYCKVLELNDEGKGFLLRSGVGWKEGLVGNAIIEAGSNSQAGYTLLSKEPVVVEDLRKETRFDGPPLLSDHGVVSGMSVIIGGLDRPYGVLGAHASRRRTFSQDDIHFLQAVSNVIAEAIARKKSEEEVFQGKQDWEATFNSITDMVTIHDKDWNIIRTNKAAERILGLPLLEKAEDKKCFKYYHGAQKPPEDCPSCTCLHSGKPGTFEIFEPHLNMFIEIRAIPRFDSNRNLVGLIHVVRDITERKKTEEYVQRQLERMSALRSIDTAISSTLDLRVTLHILLEQVIAQLKVDAADVLLLDSHTMFLNYAAGRGFRTRAIENTRIRPGQGLAGKAAMEYKTVSIPNLTRGGEALTPALGGEGFRAYFAVPLIAKGQMKGILEIFHRTPLEPDTEWINFLELLGGQAAIAVDNVSMFDTLQRSNMELTMAYDRTMEGWSRALDYRDKETEGHSQRVTELTIKIACAMGIQEDELIHIRRGALLHDIGKLGVPDAILFKPGKLTDEEWAVMKKHPVFAYELLSPIPFLRLALEIPYCHHEKWDGTGYPRGLKGEQIPLSARIFAVVDVWDALLADRPYRPAWRKEKVIEHIRSLSGTHFDPEVSEAFLKLLESR